MKSNVIRCRKSRSLPLFTALAVFSALAVPMQSHAQRLFSFDAPGSSAQAYLGTEASGINFWGTITGDVTDNSGATHGFVRTREGKFHEFDVPGANPSPGYNCLYFAGGTCPIAINDLDVVAGYYGDANGVFHGFLRTAEGKILPFDVAGSGTASGEGTYPESINDFGVIAGFYQDSSSVYHGFQRFPDGKIVTFDDSAAGTAANLGTIPESINNFGAIAGYEIDAAGIYHGFVRAADGEITNFDPPGSVASTYGLNGAFINDLGVIAGSYWRGSGNVSYGFQRNPGGKIDVYQVPDAGAAAFDGAYVDAVNLEGTTTGYVTDANVENHAFVRDANGKTTVFDVPGQLLQPNSDLGSAGEAINVAGVIAGRWHDTNLVLHAFVRLPEHFGDEFHK